MTATKANNKKTKEVYYYTYFVVTDLEGNERICMSYDLMLQSDRIGTKNNFVRCKGNKVALSELEQNFTQDEIEHFLKDGNLHKTKPIVKRQATFY